LVEVTQPFTYNGSVDAVKLASANNAGLWSVNNQATVSGFGRTSSGGSLSNELRQVNVQITNVDNANNKIRAGGNDSCQGDSGGPLSASNTQIGVVSAGGTCGTGGDYMMVSKYLDFITQTIHLLGTPDFVCGNTTFENLSKLPDGVNFQWSAVPSSDSPSNLFTVSSGSGLTFTTANNGANSGKGKIILTVTTPSGTFTHTKEVWVGKPDAITLTTDGTFSINGNTASICKTFGYCMNASSNVLLESSSTSPATSDFSPTSYIGDLERTVSTASNFTYSGWPSSNSFFNISTLSIQNDRTCFGTNNTGSYFLTVNASNSCGTNGRSVIFQVNSCGFRVFPNPAQTTLAIEFENPEMIESIPDLIEIQEEKSQKTVKIKDIKAIKNKEKNNPKAFSKIDFDLRDLPRGTYYVQMIFDGANQKSKESVRVILTD
jgi:Trypsin